MFAVFRSLLDEPCHRKLDGREQNPYVLAVSSSSRRASSCSRAVEHRSLGLRVRRDLVQTLAQARLDLVRAVLEGDERVVALTLERGPQACEPLLDALRRRVADVVQPFGQHALGLAREPLDGEIELAARRRAASSRAVRIVVSNCCDAASE